MLQQHLLPLDETRKIAESGRTDCATPPDGCTNALMIFCGRKPVGEVIISPAWDSFQARQGRYRLPGFRKGAVRVDAVITSENRNWT
jgi:hypothetical protein